VSKGIIGSFRKLNEFQEFGFEEGDFYTNCPKLSKVARDSMEAELSDVDLLAALDTCTDSAPGADGISYFTYNKPWSIARSFISNSWKHSCNTEVLPASHSYSVITLLPKDGKDTKDTKNWTQITLVLKIILKPIHK
jgi:hypothetical protein